MGERLLGCYPRYKFENALQIQTLFIMDNLLNLSISQKQETLYQRVVLGQLQTEHFKTYMLVEKFGIQWVQIVLNLNINT